MQKVKEMPSSRNLMKMRVQRETCNQKIRVNLGKSFPSKKQLTGLKRIQTQQHLPY